MLDSATKASLRTIFSRFRKSVSTSLILLSLCMVLICAGYFIYTAPGKSHTEFHDASYIPVTSLTEEATTPFLSRRGKSLQEDSLMSDKEKEIYRTSVEQFPNTRSCLTDKSLNPDIRKIDWKKMQSHSDFSVCLFRIFSSIGNPKGAQQWLLFHGYRASIQDEQYYYPPLERTRFNVEVHGVLSGKHIPFGTRADRSYWKFLNLWDLSVYAEFDPEGSLLRFSTSIASDDFL